MSGLGAAVEVVDVAPAARFSLRVGAGHAPALFSALGLGEPGGIGAVVRAGSIEALRLGPDEWLVQAQPADAPRFASTCAALADSTSHSLVDVSDRDLALGVAGPEALDLLSIGCPRDLERITVGEGRRTVFDGVSVVLWRDGPSEFRLCVSRSFAPHVRGLLENGVAELTAEAAVR